jgi:uncharacterized membrane protein
MKRAIFRILSALMIIGFISLSSISYSQPPPPPGGASGVGGTGGSSGDRTGGGAPIGGGLFILLGLGAAYGGKKIYDLRKKDLEE